MTRHLRPSRRAPTAAALPLALACAGLVACAGAPDRPDPATVQATSLLGRPLVASEPSPEERSRLLADLVAAREALAARTEDEEALIWLGRRLAYLRRYREAVEVYSRGLALHPRSHRLLRHRGHRWITLRELDRAVADLERAAVLAAWRRDAPEPDGAPNPYGVPRSTDQSNIWYHLALAQYLQHDFEAAARSWQTCLGYSRVNHDMLVATSHWLYMTLRRLGREEEARDVLAPIRADMDVLENHAYHELLLLYRGERTPEEVLGGRAGDESLPGLELATRGYGVGNWHLYNGDRESAHELFELVVRSTDWPAFGHIAAEAELARWR